MGFALVFVTLLHFHPPCSRLGGVVPTQVPFERPSCILYPIALTYPRLPAMVRSSFHIISPFPDFS